MILRMRKIDLDFSGGFECEIRDTCRNTIGKRQESISRARSFSAGPDFRLSSPALSSIGVSLIPASLLLCCGPLRIHLLLCSPDWIWLAGWLSSDDG